MANYFEILTHREKNDNGGVILVVRQVGDGQIPYDKIRQKVKQHNPQSVRLCLYKEESDLEDVGVRAEIEVTDGGFDQYILAEMIEAAKENPEYITLENLRSELPDELWQITNCKILNLRNCCLKKLPPEIGKLTNLVTLDLQENYLTELPAEIGELANLGELIVDYNELTKLPVEIGKLTNLSNLFLTHNKLTELPTEIAQLKNLVYLRLQNNCLEIPEEVYPHTENIMRYLSENNLFK